MTAEMLQFFHFDILFAPHYFLGVVVLFCFFVELKQASSTRVLVLLPAMAVKDNF